MVRKRIATLQRGLFVSPGYLDRYGQPDGLADLSQHRCLITELQRLNKTWTLSQKRQHRNLEPNWHATVANIGLLRELVLGGAGIGMLNDALCSNDVRAGRLVRLFPELERPTPDGHRSDPGPPPDHQTQPGIPRLYLSAHTRCLTLLTTCAVSGAGRDLDA